MKTKLTKKDRGFTIIEVLIVLAIAGLILAIVFLAVPALQRNARNTQRKSDAARVAAAANSFVANHNGTVPNCANWTTGSADGNAIMTEVGAMGQYTFTAGSASANHFSCSSTQPGPLAVGNGLNQAQLATAAKCNTPVDGGTTGTGASVKSMALQYVTEDAAGARIPLCLDI